VLTYADVCWRMLTYADLCWVLTYADVCWRMLTYADACWRMPPGIYETSNLRDSWLQVFWRMPTYADVCWRIYGGSSVEFESVLGLLQHFFRHASPASCSSFAAWCE
jgi:hypothetical protein